jgi:SagB-type dehydrogenase family enzyme
MKARLKVRRSGHLVSYWTDEGMVITNYATGAAVIADALVSHVLGYCSDWIDAQQLRERLPGIPPATMTRLVKSMIEQQLLVSSNGETEPRMRALDTWHAWNPAAGFFHFSTKDVARARDPEHRERVLRQSARAQGVPPARKTYPRSRSLALPPPRTTGAFPEVLLARRTWRSFDSEPVTLDDISTLLNLTWGVQRVVDGGELGPVRLKTSTSSGARQPLEAYMLVRAVDGLEPGLYHYSGDDHSLSMIRKGATGRTIQRYVPGQWWYETAAALFLMTAVFARTQWRYPFARAYRSVLFEAGHACQTFCLVATWLGLAPFCTGRFADSHVERQLRIDGITESFLYGAGVGRRPPGVAWAPWALDSSPSHPLRRRRRSSDEQE